MTIYRLEELFPHEIEARLKECPLLVMPFGTIEWHSHHLPLGLDGLVAHGLCEEIASRLGAVMAPVSYWAVGGVPYPYTLALAIEQVEPLIVSLFEQFGAMGFQEIVAFTGHFGLAQTVALKRAALAVMRRGPVTILPLTEYDLTTDADYTGDHAAEGETSLLWSMRPDLVRLEDIPAETALNGIIGTDPRQAASPEKGRQIAQAIVSRTTEVASRMLKETSPLTRSEFLRALEAGVRVLAETLYRREILPKSAVPPLNTPAFLEHCQSMYHGDYRRAAAAAERKLLDLSN